MQPSQSLQAPTWSARRWRLRAKLGLFAGAATAAVLAASAYFTIDFVSRRWMDVLRESSAADADEIKVVLDEQMATGDRNALVKLVAQIGKAPGVAWVSILDEKGRIHYSSEPAAVGTAIAPDSLEMRRIWPASPDAKARSETLLRDGCSILRTITPLPNGPTCVRCHPGTLMTGALIIDHSLKPMQEAAASTTEHVVLGAGATLIMLLATLFFGLDRAVLQRLERLRAAARRLGAGDLAARALDEADDEVGDLARDFNHMAERLEGAVTGLAAERRQLEEIVNGIADGVVLLDRTLTVVATNRSFQARLAGQAGTSAGCSYRDLVEAAGSDVGCETSLPAERALESGNLEKDLLIISAPYGERFEELYAQPLRSPDGTVSGVIEVWRDSTDRKALEAGLEQSERLAALGLIATSVAHEVGNPLAAIVIAVDALLDRLEGTEGDGPAEMRQYLQVARKQVFRCRAVTDRLLGFARAPSAEVTRVDAASAAREVLALIRPQAASQGVEIRASLDERLWTQAADLLLEQVFLNLVTNALRAMPKGGVLAVSAQIEGACVLVRFSDTGHGMAESVRRQLFQPFHRFRPDKSGTGLGLFISHTLVARCGGTIEVESAEGQGATFTVRLHCAPAARLGQAEAFGMAGGT